MSSSEIHIYTDGSSRGNPGPGGYGIILLFGGHRKELSKGFRLTTNNRMELLAVIDALKALKKNEHPIVVHTDSQYVVNAINKGWLKTWISTNFKGGKKNKDLWTEYHQLSTSFHLKFIWIKGHNNHHLNERCDELATAAADGQHLHIDAFYEEEVKGSGK
jgi:ribonuclease HI